MIFSTGDITLWDHRKLETFLGCVVQGSWTILGQFGWVSDLPYSKLVQALS